MQTELRDVLASALAELPPHYRAAIFLRDVEGLSMAEVAVALGVTVGTVKTRAHRARLLLRKRLSTFMASASASVDGSIVMTRVRQPSVRSRFIPEADQIMTLR